MKKLAWGLVIVVLSTTAWAQERDGSIVYDGPMPNVTRQCNNVQNPTIGYAVHEGKPKLLAVFETGRAGKWLELEDLGAGLYRTGLQYQLSPVGIYDATGAFLGYCRTP